MKILLKVIILLLVFSVASCSFNNQPTVLVTIDSDPVGAKIYINDIYYGDTTRVVSLIPKGSYHLRLIKDGYQTIDHEMKTEFSMRKNRQEENMRCKTDLVGSIFIIPIKGLKSIYCRDFVQEVYGFELALAQKTSTKKSPPKENSLNKIDQPILEDYNPEGYEPLKENVSSSLSPYAHYIEWRTNKNYPLTSDKSVRASDKSDILEENAQKNPSSQPLFNSHSEFANDGNDTKSRNFNRKNKINYYNWQ